MTDEEHRSAEIYISNLLGEVESDEPVESRKSLEDIASDLKALSQSDELSKETDALLSHNLGKAFLDLPLGDPALNVEYAVQYLRKALSIRTKENAPLEWASTMSDLGFAYSEREVGNRSENIEESIRCYKEALRAITRDDFPMQWASTMHELAIAYRDRLEGLFSENIEESIRCCREALSVYSKDANPMEWASTIHCLANGYLERMGWDPWNSIEEALNYYGQVMSVWSKDAFPTKWALVMHNLGLAYSRRIEGGGSENMEESIRCYGEALSVQTKEAAPMDWARTRNNLANVYWNRTEGAPSDNMEEIIRCYRDALSVWTKDTAPGDWANAMHNLSIAYSERIEGCQSENLEESIRCTREALSVWTKDTVPVKWALSMHGLANSYTKRKKGVRSENMEESIRCYGESLSVLTKDAAPTKWALTMFHLGNGYRDRIEGEPSENIEDMLRCYKEALTVWTRSTAPKDWTMVTYNLAKAYRKRMEGNPSDNLEESIRYYRDVLTVLTKDADPTKWALIMHELGNVYSKRIEGNRPGNLEESIRCFTEALSVLTKDAAPMDWAMVFNNLGSAYRNRIEGNPSENLEESIRCFKNALCVQTKDAVPMDWALTMQKLGEVYRNRIEGSPSGNIEESIRCYKEALSVRTKDLDPVGWASTMHGLGVAYSERIEGSPSENMEESIRCYTQALSALAKSALQWALTMHDLGNGYRNRKEGNESENLEESIRCYRKSLTSLRKDAFPMQWASAMHDLGIAYHDRIEGNPFENLEEALRCYEEALCVRTRDSVPMQWALTSYFKGLGLYKQYKQGENKNESLLDESLENLWGSIEAISESSSYIANPSFRRRYLKRISVVYHDVVEIFLEEGRYFDAVYSIERIRSRGLLEGINLEHLKPGRIHDPERIDVYWQTCHGIRNLRAQLAHKRMTDDASDPMELPLNSPLHEADLDLEARNQLAALLDKQKQILQEMTEIDPDYVALIQAEALSERDLYELLSTSGSAAVQLFCRSPEGILHFLVAYAKDDKVEYFHHYDRGSAQSLKRKLESFLGSSGNITPLTELLEEAGKVMQPVVDFLKNVGIRRIYMSPHSFLELIPLHAARLPKEKRYLIEDFLVCYTPSLTTSYRLARAGQNEGGMVLSLFYAPPDNPLPHGRREFETIGSTYGPDRVITLEEGDANLKGLKSTLCNHSEKIFMLSMICHGEVSSAGESFLHLSEGQVPSAALIGELMLGGLPVAVIPDCKTGMSLEGIQGYEEYRALDSIFLMMGARRVISSFFPVHDEGTLRVMEQFHKNIENGAPPIEALHMAQGVILGVALPDEHHLGQSDFNRGRITKKKETIEAKNEPGQERTSASHPYYWAFLKVSGAFDTPGFRLWPDIAPFRARSTILGTNTTLLS